MEQANEIQETLGRTYGLPDDIDEDELEAGQIEISFKLNTCPTHTNLFVPNRTGSAGRRTRFRRRTGADVSARRACATGCGKP